MEILKVIEKCNAFLIYAFKIVYHRCSMYILYGIKSLLHEMLLKIIIIAGPVIKAKKHYRRELYSARKCNL